ncbi:hypothetical protein QVD17_18155 [Tagetes erecta]|uniref:Uncharacterized protein n=1 Tax=Tagetes erecta TaxID=13708 RepID=A0AAD8NW38_TARER|nr:hypothetical protein QVD17_18155 [Tagetes erecta]
MWAHTTLSCSLLPPATGTVTGTGRCKQFPFTVSAKQSRKNIQYEYEDEQSDNDNDRELEALKQQELEDLDPDAYVSNSEKITGSAVLLALQKANAQKTSKKITKKKKSKLKAENNQRKQGDAIEIEDYSDVKPLCIKSDWKDRLDDLEMQLHQLIHHA